MKKASEAEIDKQKLDLVNSLLNYLTRTSSRTLRLLNTRMLNLWKWTFLVLLFHHGSAKVSSPIMAPNTWIFIPNTRIIIPNTQNNLKGCVLLEPKNTRTKGNTRFGQNTFHSLHLQRRICPLTLLKGLLCPK